MQMRNKEKGKLTIIISGMLLVSMISMWACSGEKMEAGVLSQQETTEYGNTTLSFFYSGENTGWIGAMEELCEDFMKKYPSITINMEYSSSQSYTEELKAKEATDEFPDVFEIENPYMFESARKLGVINQEIGNLVEKPIIIDNKIYALPFYSTSYGIVYNQILFKKYNLEIPKTYEEFLHVCGELKYQGIAPLAIGGSEESSELGWMSYFFLTEVQEEGDDWQIQKKKKEVSFQDQDMKKALQDFQNLMTGEYILEDSLNMSDNQIISQMINQKVAMYYGTPAMLTKIWEAYPKATDSGKTPLGEEIENDTSTMRLGWFYLPDEKGKSVVIDKIGSILSVSRECMKKHKKKEAAETFLKFCFEKDNYRKILQAMYGMPTTKDAVLYAAPAVQQGVLTDYRYAERSENFLGNMETPESFQADMKEILDNLAADIIGVDDAAKKLDEGWDDSERIEQ